MSVRASPSYAALCPVVCAVVAGPAEWTGDEDPLVRVSFNRLRGAPADAALLQPSAAWSIAARGAGGRYLSIVHMHVAAVDVSAVDGAPACGNMCVVCMCNVTRRLPCVVPLCVRHREDVQ